MRSCRSASSRELVTDTHSPRAIEQAPASRPAMPPIRMVWLSTEAPATPMTRLRFEQRPSLAPSTAARRALPPMLRCRLSSRASSPPEAPFADCSIDWSTSAWVCSSAVILVACVSGWST